MYGEKVTSGEPPDNLKTCVEDCGVGDNDGVSVGGWSVVEGWDWGWGGVWDIEGD